jgi:hypothetical protein
VNRTRRIATTVVAATGILGGAGGAVAIAVSSRDPGTPTATTAPAGTGTVDHPDATEQDRQALAAYIASMSARGHRLERRLGLAEAQLAQARAAHATRVARAAAAARAAEQAQAQARAQSAAPPAAPPTTHTSTGASGASGSGGDDGEREGHDD